jgi:ferritin-like metal-binding protein YciE
MIETLEQLLQDEIRDIYDAEKQLVKAIPKMAKAASSTELSDALRQHLEQTQGQVQRLEQVFEALGTMAKAKLAPQ